MAPRSNDRAFVLWTWTDLCFPSTSLLYFASLALPVLERYQMPEFPSVNGGGPHWKVYYGGDALLLGWIEAPIAWMANCFLVVGAVCLMARKWKACALAGAIAPLAGFSTLFVYDPASLRFGYACWQASLVVFAIGAIGAWITHSKKSRLGPSEGTEAPPDLRPNVPEHVTPPKQSSGITANTNSIAKG